MFIDKKLVVGEKSWMWGKKNFVGRNSLSCSNSQKPMLIDKSVEDTKKNCTQDSAQGLVSFKFG